MQPFGKNAPISSHKGGKHSGKAVTKCSLRQGKNSEPNVQEQTVEELGE